MNKKISRIRKFPFDDNTYVVFEEFRTLSGRYLFSDVYYKDISDSAYLGQYNELDNPNIWVLKHDDYIIIYEYIIPKTTDPIDNKLVKNIINLYSISDDNDLFGKYGQLINIFNQNEEILRLGAGVEHKKIKQENRRRHYSQRDKKIVQNVVKYEVVHEDEVKNIDNIDRTEYNHPTKGIYDFVKKYIKK